METIREALSKIGEKQSLTISQKDTRQLSPAVLQKTIKVREKYGDELQFMNKFHPSDTLTIGRNSEIAFFGDAPSLVIMRKTYGDDFPATWLLTHIFDLVAFSNSQGTLNESQAEFLAEAIANEYYFLKASELMLFFYRFKAGAYGHFYGVVDPMKIMEGLKQFMKERASEIERHESELRDREREEDSKNAISLREYCRSRGIPETDDMHEALRFLNVNAPKD